MFLNIEKTKDSNQFYDIVANNHRVQPSFNHFKRYYCDRKNHFDQKIIQKLYPTSSHNKLYISKVKRKQELDYSRKLKQHYSKIPSTSNFNRAPNNINQYNKNSHMPKKTVQITKINNLLNQFKTKYDALSKKINLQTQPQISNLNISKKLDSIRSPRAPIKSIVRKNVRFSIQPKIFEKQSYQVISSPNLIYSKSVQNLSNSNFPLKTLNTPDALLTFSYSKMKRTLNQRSQDNFNISIEMAIQNNTNIKDKKSFPSLQTVQSKNDISSQADQNQSDIESIVQESFKQFPCFLIQRQIQILNKVRQNSMMQQRLLPERKFVE